MITKTEKTFTARIYMSGPIETAKQICRRLCYAQGLCVTVDPTLFIYTGGEETGFVVGLINYPRFPADERGIEGRAFEMAHALLAETYQHSALIVTPEKTTWITTRTDK